MMVRFQAPGAYETNAEAEERLATEAGRLAASAGRIPKKLYATASSPTAGIITPR